MAKGFFRSGARLVKFPLRAGRIGQNTFRNGKDCSVYIRDRFGLVKMALRVGRIGENSFRSEQDCSQFLEEQVGPA